MASFGIAANTSWSFFLDRDNGIFYEMLTYPLSRSQYLLGKVLFNVLVGVPDPGATCAWVAPTLPAGAGVMPNRSWWAGFVTGGGSAVRQ